MTNFYQVTFQNCGGERGPEYRVHINAEEYSKGGVVSWPSFDDLVKTIYPVLSLDNNPVKFVPDNLPDVEKGILEDLVLAHNLKWGKSQKSL